MSEQTSKVITTLRYPLALLVIMCHSEFFTQPAGTSLLDWDSWRGLLHMQLFFSEVIIHVAVPLFMLFSGMLLFRKGMLNASSYGQQLLKRVHTLLIPYLVWSTFSFLMAVGHREVSCTFLHWLQGLWDSTLWSNGGVFRLDLPGYPMNMPLWFIRDLMILMVLSYPIGWALQVTRGWVLLLMALWWFPGHEKFFGFGADVLFYFSLGAWLSLRQIDLFKWLRRVRIMTYLWAIIMLVVETIIQMQIFDETNQVGFKWIPFNLYVVSMMLAMLNLAYDLKDRRIAQWSCTLAGSTFFLYAAHYVFLPYLQRALYGVFLPSTEWTNILFYWFFLIGYISLLTASFYLLRRLFPKTVAFLTGGRL